MADDALRVVDLSIALDANTPVFPGDPPFSREALEHDGIHVSQLVMRTHHGTHIDAPSHMVAEGKTLSDFPVETFVGDAIVLDVRGKKKIDVPLNGIATDFVFFLMDAHAVLSEQLAHALIDKNIRIVGVSTMSPDVAPYPVHKILLPANVLIVENLTNLEELIDTKFRCVIAPLRITGADGAPCRVLALLE